MELPAASRAAVIERAAALIGTDRPAPRQWSDLSVTEQLLIQERDCELADVLQGRPNAATELQLLSGQWPTVAPRQTTEAEMRQQAIDQWCADHPYIDPTEAAHQLNRQVAARTAAAEMARQESAAVAARVLAAQGAAARGW